LSGVRSLLLTTSFPPALGGVETMLYQTNRRLADPPLVLAPSPAAAPGMEVRSIKPTLGQRATYRPVWWLHPSLHYLQVFWRPALSAARGWRPRVIQVGHINMAPLAWLLARRLRIPYLVYLHGQEVWRAGRPSGRRLLDSRLRGGALCNAQRIVVAGTFTASLAREWNVRGERIAWVPFGAEPRSEPPSLPEGRLLLTVARLVPRKGIDVVIRALRLLPSDVTYRVVGSGPDEWRLKVLAHDEGVGDRVAFVGRVDERTLADEYRRCALFVLPARRTSDGALEGFGLVYFEAAAWGRPAVAGRSGGEVDAVVDGQTGILVDGRSVDQVADAIAGLLGDQTRLRTLGDAARHRVQTVHNWTSAAAAIDRVLAELA
jgi:phosphatidylinositol alpha-1,6-mannosyltransferase